MRAKTSKYDWNGALEMLYRVYEECRKKLCVVSGREAGYLSGSGCTLEDSPRQWNFSVPTVAFPGERDKNGVWRDRSHVRFVVHDLTTAWEIQDLCLCPWHLHLQLMCDAGLT